MYNSLYHYVVQFVSTGKNDLTQRVTHREAVSGTLIHAYLMRGTMRSYGPVR